MCMCAQGVSECPVPSVSFESAVEQNIEVPVPSGSGTCNSLNGRMFVLINHSKGTGGGTRGGGRGTGPVKGMKRRPYKTL